MAQRYQELSDERHKLEGHRNSLTMELDKQSAALRHAEDEKKGYLSELKNKENQMNVRCCLMSDCIIKPRYL